jgi:UDP-N-acetylmuramate--alanine ligase
MFRGKIRRIHFVGIGGSGMSGIAEVLINMDFAVSGSDLKEGPVTRRLRALGGTIFIGHDEANVAGVDVVVRSTAVSVSNPELRAAEQNKIPIIPRAEMLAELMRMKYGLAVAGTHGKTTTTSMLATCLHRAGLDPTIVIGGRLDSMGSSARLGAGDYMVAEADESDGSFLHLSPTVAVITNIDPEHLDHWGSMEALVDGFAAFANKVPFFGFSALCLDHPTVQALLPRLRRRVVTFGLNPQAEVRAVDVRLNGLNTHFKVVVRDEPLVDIELAMPGMHNVRNALAAISVCLELDLAPHRIQEALQGFSGVDRRFSVRAELALPGDDAALVTLVDDYGHHPTEIATTLEATRLAFPGRRVVAVAQPHRYTRVRDLFEDFARCFNDAAHVVVCPLYAAGEAPLPGVDHHSLAAGVARHGHRSVIAVDSLEAATRHLEDFVRPGDLVITLGAGDVNRVCDLLAAGLQAGTAHGSP